VPTSNRQENEGEKGNMGEKREGDENENRTDRITSQPIHYSCITAYAFAVTDQ